MDLPAPFDIRPDIYDENSVFKRLFADEKAQQKASRPNRLPTIFKEAPNQEPPLSVGDFLPQI